MLRHGQWASSPSQLTKQQGRVCKGGGGVEETAAPGDLGQRGRKARTRCTQTPLPPLTRVRVAAMQGLFAQ